MKESGLSIRKRRRMKTTLGGGASRAARGARDKDEEDSNQAGCSLRTLIKLTQFERRSVRAPLILRLEVESLKMSIRSCACIPPEKHITHNKVVVLSILPLADCG